MSPGAWLALFVAIGLVSGGLVAGMAWYARRTLDEQQDQMLEILEQLRRADASEPEETDEARG